MDALASSLIVVFSGITLISILGKRLGFPVIVLEIIFGIVIGVSYLNLIPDHETIHFLEHFGLAYLLFLAGLELDFLEIKQYARRALTIAAASVVVPFAAGALLGHYIGAPPLLLGSIFAMSSLGIAVPAARELQGHALFKHILLASVIIVDIVGMFLLAFALAHADGNTGWSFFYSLSAIVALFVIPFIVRHPNVRDKIDTYFTHKKNFDAEVRLSFAIIFILAAVTGELGFHSVIGAFIAGMVIAELTPKASLLDKKLESFGYGFFIPLFFVYTGAQVNMPALFSNLSNIKLLVMIIALAIAAKMAAVYFTAKLKKMPMKESLSLSCFHATKLSLAVAASQIAHQLGLIDANLFATIVLLAISSAVIMPAIGQRLLGIKELDPKAELPLFNLTDDV